jgi:hypothetical protein
MLRTAVKKNIKVQYHNVHGVVWEHFEVTNGNESPTNPFPKARPQNPRSFIVLSVSALPFPTTTCRFSFHIRLVLTNVWRKA